MERSAKRDTKRPTPRTKRRRKKIEWVPIFFLLMFIYLGVHIVYYATKERYPLYEVPRAEAVNENEKYQGFILREEYAYTAQQEGYVNYYIASGRRAALGATVCTLDKDGEFSEMILSTTGEGQVLSATELKKVVQRMKNLQQDFDGMDFQDVYDTKSAISAVIMDSLTATAIETLNETMGITGFTRILSERSGIVSFTSDCYDEWTEEQLTLECLTGEAYTRTVTAAGEKKQVGEFIYKLVTDEAFQIYFEIDEKDARAYGLDTAVNNRVSVTIYLEKIQQNVKVDMTLIQMNDGNMAAKLCIPKYGSNYVNERYIEFEIVKDDVYGMKIPVTAVIEKDYFMIPVDFVPTGDDYSGDGVLKQTSSGEAIFVSFDSYKVDREAGWYYVWTDELAIGDYLIKVNSEETYQIISTSPITGVYEANQGYTEFKIVTILQETEDKQYYLIKPKVSFGIAPFDYIVIEADKVMEGQVLE